MFKLKNENNVTAKSLAYRWIEGHEIFEDFMCKYPKNALRIKYEDLVKNENEVFSIVANFLDFKFELKRLKNIREKAKSIVVSQETWKSENLENDSLFVKKDYNWKINERFMLNFILNKYLSKFNYVKKISFAQYLFNFLIRITPILNRLFYFLPFKSFFKNIIKKLDFWPLK